MKGKEKIRDFVFYSVLSDSISSIGLGGGVVPIVQPIHAPIAKIATKAISTGTATRYSLNVDADKSHPIMLTTSLGHIILTVYPTITTAQTRKIIHPIA
jgi:hypothetical protein